MKPIDLLIAELAQLKERVTALERAAFAPPDGYVVGWVNAAKLVGVGQRTCKRRYLSGDFPAPCKRETIERDLGGPIEKMTWRRAALIAYAEGR